MELTAVHDEGAAGSTAKGKSMNLPKIDISALPDLNTVTGIFGSLGNAAHAQMSDDTYVVMMVFVYEFLK